MQLARGLRFQRPALRPRIPGDPLPQSAPCPSLDAKSGPHLLVCRAFSLADQQTLHATFQRIALELLVPELPCQRTVFRMFEYLARN
jgi:hypothetical protein